MYHNLKYHLGQVLQVSVHISNQHLLQMEPPSSIIQSRQQFTLTVYFTISSYVQVHLLYGQNASSHGLIYNNNIHFC
jgi:hypothetical protein